MTKRAQRRPRKPPAQRRARPPASLPSVADFDRSTARRMYGFYGRMAVLFVVVSVLSTWAPIALRLPRAQAQIIVFAAAFGVMLPFWRGLDRVCAAILAGGRAYSEAGLHAEAIHVLSYFDRWGNMSFDRTGEAHYLLASARAATGDLKAAIAMATWTVRHRSRGAWGERAEAAATTWRRRLERQEAQTADETGRARETGEAAPS